MPKAKPILYLGTLFPSQHALAKHLGITYSSVHSRIRRGTLEQDNDTRLNLLLGPLSNRQPVSAHGHYWPSQKAAAKDLGVTTSAVSKALEKGTFDRLVLRRLGPKDGMAHSPRE